MLINLKIYYRNIDGVSCIPWLAVDFPFCPQKTNIV